MTEGDRRRSAIFKRYSDNLKLLISKGVINSIVLNFDSTYICPICTRQFSEQSLDQKCNNPLTLEDAPPKSLGGKANILTCRECNNSCGQNIDHHLSERMKELDRAQFLPRVEFNAKFERDGRQVQGTIRIEEDGTITAIHKKRNNEPNKLENFIKSLIPKGVINLFYRETRVDPFKLQIALLKTGYLLTFAKYGYAFILQNSYDRIRQQLLNPDAQTYPTEFWFQPPLPREVYGVPFITEKGLESICPIFPLTTDHSERPFATIIPLAGMSVEKIIQELKSRFKSSKNVGITMDPMGPDTDYLTDLIAIRKMLSWITSINR